MDELPLITALHLPQERQGPGGDSETRLAMRLAGLDPRASLDVLDIGCGTGASSLLLAQALPAARVTAVDFLPAFLRRLTQRAKAAGLAEHIATVEATMEALPFPPASYDVIWSEGAIYNMGFEAGISAWRPLLRDNGLLVASEITWLTAHRPQELEAFWQSAYPQIDTAAGKLRVLERNGFAPVAWFALPQHCWTDNYYAPLQARFDDFLTQQGSSEAAAALIATEREEIAMYQRYGEYYSYGMYIARRSD
jgi:SAM-dependent methyltransferase